MNKVTVAPDNKPFSDYQRGDIGQPLKPNNDQWMICCPGCGLLSTVQSDNIILHESGAVSTRKPLHCHGRNANRQYAIEENAVRWIV